MVYSIEYIKWYKNIGFWLFVSIQQEIYVIMQQKMSSGVLVFEECATITFE